MGAGMQPKRAGWESLMKTTMTRRSAVAGCAGAAALFALGGAGSALAGQGDLLRPPGAQDEDRFLATCVKCNRCESMCPQGSLRVAKLEDGLLNWRTPAMDFHRGICDFCGKCQDVCPSGAIVGASEETSCIGVAVVDPERCLAWQQSGCQLCVEACIYGAISLDASGRPVVDKSKCNGCGRCEYKCPSNSYLSYGGGKKRGINVELAGGEQ